MLVEQYRTAFITGASTGIGAAVARMLRAEGVRVWGTARSTARLTEWAGDADFHAVVLDLGDENGAVAAYERASAEAGGFDLVINNAGYGVFGRFDETASEVWRAQFTAMLLTTMRLAQLAIGEMRGRGRGCLVNVASLATEFPLPFMSGYNVAKAGLSALSESLLIETRGTGVTVLDFRPGDYRTGFNQNMHTNATTAPAPSRDATAERCWRRLEENIASAPEPAKAAQDLRRALAAGRSGVVRSGGFFQATLAPLLFALVPRAVGRWFHWRYLGVR